MSSSKKKQARKGQGANSRNASAAQEAKQLKRYTVTFWIVIALVMVIFIGAVANQFIFDPIVNAVNNSVYPKTEAIKVGDHTLTSVDLNYFYVGTFNTYYYNIYSTYYYYIYLGYLSMEDCLGFSLSKSLAKQDLTSDMQTALDTKAETWADYFMEATAKTIKQTYALYDLAVQNNHKLTDDEQKSLDSSISSLETQAEDYKSVKAYLRDVYGNGADKESYVNYLTVSAYASSYYNAYSESLEFTDEELSKFVGDEGFKYNSYNFSYYKINVSDFLKKAGTTATKEEQAAAVAAAKAAAEKLANGEYADLDAFLDAVRALDKEITATKKENSSSSSSGETKAASSDDTSETTEDKDDSKEDEKEEELPDNYTEVEETLYSGILSALQDWIVGKTEVKSDSSDKDEEKTYEYNARKEGEIGLVPNNETEADVTIFYVVRYDSCIDNEYLMKDVRHILIKCTGKEGDDGSITFSDLEAAEKAKTKAEEVLAEFKKDATAEKFGELADKNSEDTGSNTNGGLYENIYKGMMVSQFEDWCYDEARKAGDTDIITTTNGYHIMYFVGDTDITYRTYMVTEDLRAETVEDWLEELTDSIAYNEITLKHLKVKYN